MSAEPDELDRRIISELTVDPRRSYAEIGKQLGVSGATVSSRIERLREEKLLSFEVRPDLEAFGLTIQILAAVEVNPAALADVTATLRAAPNVLRLDHITGGFNIHFIAAFRGEAEVGALLRQLQTTSGVRRVVVQHVMETVRLADGWAAVLAPAGQPDPPAYGMVPGVQVPAHLEGHLQTVAAWVYAYVGGDLERLRILSQPDVVLEILRPRSAAGTFEGVEAVARAGARLRQVYRRWWYRVTAVREAEPPFNVVVDALSPAEDFEGHVTTVFSRNAFTIDSDRVARVTSFGAMPLEDPTAALPPEAHSLE